MCPRDTSSYKSRFLERAALTFDCGITLDLEQTDGEQSAEENMQSAVWDGAINLATAMQDLEVFPSGYWHGKRVLECGAGCGCTGIMAARLGAHAVFLTDLKPLLPLLHRNAKHNGVADVACVRELEWGSEIGEAFGPIDVILGAEITCFVQTLQDLAHTLRAVASARTEIYLAHRQRGMENFMVEEFSPYFCITALPQSASTAGNILIYKMQLRADSCLEETSGSEFATDSPAPSIADGEAHVPQDVVARAARGDIAALKALIRR